MEIPYDTFVKPYNKPAEPMYYNKFFNPNICHVCKRRLGTCELIKVCECSMISYCCDEHKGIHQKQHQDLCNAIIKVNGHKVLWDTCSTNIVEWTDTKKRLLELVQAELHRELKSYEKEVFLFVKSCFICYRRPDREENFCRKCHCINYCNAHESALHMHKYFCSQLELSLSLDLGIIECFEYPRMDFIMDFPKSNQHLCDMIEFMKQYVLQPEQDTWFIYDFIFTDYTSGPLTVFYGLTEMQLMNCSSKTKPFIIHIIDAKFMDTNNLPAWELLMHLFKTSLIVVMIGQHLDEYIETSIYVNVCALCSSRSNRLQFEFYRAFYDDYVNKNPFYKPPNLIVGFNVVFPITESWSGCIQIIQTQNCPLLLTTTSRCDSLENMRVINKALGNIIQPFYHTLNKFCGYTPHRDSNYEYVYVLNKRLIIYKNLHKKFIG